MVSLQRVRFRMHSILALGICLLLFSTIPAHQLQAATKQQEINNALADFKDGQFQRTSLANVVRSDPNALVSDQVGGVQLGPVGLLKSWKPGVFTLPKPIFGMGSVAFGNRIFIIGGLAGGGANAQRTAEVWSVAVSQLDGALLGSGWDAEPSLIPVQGSDQGLDGSSPNFTTPVAPIAYPAVTSVADASGANGYIYVIGGNANIGNFDFSSYAVRIATVTNGRISGNWVEQTTARIPSLDPNNPFIPSRGAQEAMAVTAQVGGKTYVYLIGGLQRFINGASTVSSGLKTVFYARVGSGGKLYKPSTSGDSAANEGWERNPQDIPVTNPASVAGLWDASAVADNFVASTLSAANAIYVIGGQVTPAQDQVTASYSSTVYRALINSNGTLNWNGWQGVVLSPRSQSTAIAFRGNIYMAGGVPNGNTSTNSDGVVLTSYVEDDLTLHQFDNLPVGIDGNGTNFLQSNGTGNGVLPRPRKLHSSVLVRADASSPTSAFMYVLGGIGAPDDLGTDDNGSDTVFYGKIGGGEDVSTTGYAADGWYYGQPFNVAQQFNQVQVQEIDWTSNLTRTTSEMDIALDYRLSNSNDCATATWDEWLPLDGLPNDALHFSADGQNLATIADATARCFQYRARLTTADPFATPVLLNVSVKVNVPGGPDLSLKSLTDQRGIGNAFLGLSVVIQNVNTVDPPTLAADIDKKGSFFVDLCIFGPGVPVVPPTLPLTTQNMQCSKAYANVNRSLMGPDVTYTIPQWKDSVTNNVVNLTQYFKQPGTYNVIVATDSFNNVDEGLKGGENNNVSQTFTFNVAKTGIQVSLPLVGK